MSDAMRHEPPGIDMRRTVIVSAASGALLVGVIWAAGLLRSDGPPPAMSLPASPRLEEDPGRQLRELRAWEDARLSSYAWTDRTAGRVRIPIERAMDLVAERERRR
jgi:hypothetical protein